MPWKEGVLTIQMTISGLVILDNRCFCVSHSVMSNSLLDCSLPGAPVHRILQARILEWVAIPFSRDLPHRGISPP